MGQPITIYAVFDPKQGQGRFAAFSRWIGRTRAEVKAQLFDLGYSNRSGYEVRSLETHTVAAGDIWRFLPEGAYKDTPWVRIDKKTRHSHKFGGSEWRVALSPTRELPAGETIFTTLWEAYIMLYAELVESVDQEDLGKQNKVGIPMITSKLESGQVLVPLLPEPEYHNARFRLMSPPFENKQVWLVEVWLLRGSQWVLNPNPAQDHTVFHENWLRQNCFRICECQEHPSPDGVCELAIDDEKWMKNAGLCAWCREGHPRS